MSTRDKLRSESSVVDDHSDDSEGKEVGPVTTEEEEACPVLATGGGDIEMKSSLDAPVLSSKDKSPSSMSSVGSTSKRVDWSQNPLTEAPSSKYHATRFWKLLRLWDYLLWLLNKVILYRPFALLSNLLPKDSDDYFGLSKCLYDLSVADIVFFVLVFSAAIGGTVDYLNSSNSGGLGESAGQWFAIVWILAQRNTLWNWCLCLSPERMYFYHKCATPVPFLLGIYHGLLEDNDDRRRLQAADMRRAQRDAESSERIAWMNENIGGSLRHLLSSDEGGGMFGSDRGDSGWWIIYISAAIFVTAFFMVRRKFFTAFLYSHWVLFICLYLAMSDHNTGGGIKIALFLSVADWCVRALLVGGRPVVVKRMQVLPGNVVKIVFDMSNFKYSAGQWVDVYMPKISWFESHPFSLSSFPEDFEMSIHIRPLGPWTTRLLQFVKGEEMKGRTDWSKLYMFVEGPYGGSYLDARQYKNVLFFSGGIGITPLQSIFNQLIADIKHGRGGGVTGELPPIQKNIQFVWTVRDPKMVDEFSQRHWSAMEEMADGNAEDEEKVETGEEAAVSRLPAFFSPNLLIVSAGIHALKETTVSSYFYVTRGTPEERERLRGHEFIREGRPNVEEMVDDFSELSQSSCASDILVLVCGPPALVQRVRRATAKHMIDCHSEIFEF